MTLGTLIEDLLTSDEGDTILFRNRIDSLRLTLVIKSLESKSSVKSTYSDNVDLLLNKEYYYWSKYETPSQDFKPDWFNSYYHDSFLNDLHRAKVLYSLNFID